MQDQSKGWVYAAMWFEAVLSPALGIFLGLLADNWLGTPPWLAIAGGVAGVVTGVKIAISALRAWQKEGEDEQ